jgi:hypothetical protein
MGTLGIRVNVLNIMYPMDIVNSIMDYESGDMSHEGEILFFQQLIDTGLAWTLQGSYGRTAIRLIKAGLCTEKGNNNASTPDCTNIR